MGHHHPPPLSADPLSNLKQTIGFRKASTLIIPLLLTAAGVAILFSNIYADGYPIDESYQALCVRDYSHSPLAMLTFFNGYCWTKLFGFTLLSLRVLTRICYIIAIGIGCLYLYQHSRNRLLSSVIFTISCLITDLGGFGIYNWDTGAYPIEAIWTVTLLYFYDRPSIKLIALLGFLSGIMVLTRLPLLSMSIVVLVTISYRSRTSILKSGLLYVIVMTLTILAVGIAITGSPETFFGAFDRNNIISGHSVSSISRYYWLFMISFPFIFISWVPISLCYACACAGTRRDGMTVHRAIILSSLCLMTGWSVLRLKALEDGYDNAIFGIGLPFALILTIIVPFISFLRPNIALKIDNSSKFKAALLVTILFCISLGSDAMFERWNIAFIFPIAAGVMYDNFIAKSAAFIRIWLSLSILTLSTMWIYKTCKIKENYVIPTREISRRGELPVTTDFNLFWDEITDDIESIKARSKRFSFFGAMRYPLTLEYEEQPTYSIQKFHYHNYSLKQSIPDFHSFDYIFLTAEKDISDLYKYRDELINAGFIPIKTATHYILMENQSK